MSQLYLTIDDSPSDVFAQYWHYLLQKGINAAFFVRGDLLSQRLNEGAHAIANGFHLINHCWSHGRSSQLGAEATLAEIDRTQAVIDLCYELADVARPGPYIRFPHMDSGMGAWPLPPEQFNEGERAEMRDVYRRFYNSDMAEPTAEGIACHNAIEAGLKARGYRQMVFQGVIVDWYLRYAASSAMSTQGTFCHPDWWLNARHLDKFGPDVTDPVARLNANFDAFVAAHPDSAHVLVMHDAVELWPHFPRLIEHMIERGDTFLPIPA